MSTSMLALFAIFFAGVKSFQLKSSHQKPIQVRRNDPGSDYTEYVDWRICNSSDHSNLGNLGPDDGDDNIRFSDVATSWEGQVLDLIITNITKYTPKDNSKNGRIDCMGNINVKTISETVTLQFMFVETGTESPVASSYLFSVYDVDYGKSGSEVVNFITSVTGYWVTDDSVLTESGSIGEGSLSFSAGAKNVDNPSDPANMTEEQMNNAVTVMYENTSTFKIKFSVEDASGKAGRNILFSGWSELAPTLEPTPVPTPVPTVEPTPVPTPVPTPGYIDWSLCDVDDIVNNLGNLGPEEEAADEMRFKEVYMGSDGTAYDLLVTNTTEYFAHNITKNGHAKCFGLVNVKAQTSVTLQFKFVESGTSTEAEPADYYFTIWDIDQLEVEGGESVTFVTSVGEYSLSDDSNIAVSGSIDSNLTFDSTSEGDESNNPTSLSGVTDAQKNNAGSVFYEDVSSFKITFSAAGNSIDGRNFMFSGMSQLSSSVAKSKHVSHSTK